MFYTVEVKRHASFSLHFLLTVIKPFSYVVSPLQNPHTCRFAALISSTISIERFLGSNQREEAIRGRTQSKKGQGPCRPVAARLVGVFHNLLFIYFVCRSYSAIIYHIFDKNLCINSGSFFTRVISKSRISGSLSRSY